MTSLRAADPRDPAVTPRPEPSPELVRVAVLMGQESSLDAVCAVIRGRAPELDVVVSTTAWLQLVRSPRFPTDIVVLDYDLADAISLEGRIRACRGAGTSVIVISRVDSVDVRRRVLAAGAAALLTGPSLPTDIVGAVRSVAAARAVVSGPGSPDAGDRAAPPASYRSPRLSQGEEQALRLYITGCSTQEVALRMNVQYETAKTYLRRVRAKYRLVERVPDRRADLIERAAEDGYGR